MYPSSCQYFQLWTIPLYSKDLCNTTALKHTSTWSIFWNQIIDIMSANFRVFRTASCLLNHSHFTWLNRTYAESCLVRKMKSKNILDNVLYAGLLLWALLFIKQPFENFLNRITDHSFTHAPITLNDLPTVTVCFMQPSWFRGQDDRYHHRSTNNLKIGKHLHLA